jgi:hypothetical protein
MIEFNEIKNTGISPENTEADLPNSKSVKLFFESKFKKNVDQYMIYKKNQFNNPNKEVLMDFLSKFESFLKSENMKEDGDQIIDLAFQNIKNSFKILEESKKSIDNEKVMAFFVSFITSKFLS